MCHHQIHFLKLKMRQNPFSAGTPPGPHWGAHDTPPFPSNSVILSHPQHKFLATLMVCGRPVVPNCSVQRTRTKFAERAFSVAGPSAWNSLPADLRLEPNTAVF